MMLTCVKYVHTQTHASKAQWVVAISHTGMWLGGGHIPYWHVAGWWPHPILARGWVLAIPVAGGLSAPCEEMGEVL